MAPCSLALTLPLIQSHVRVLETVCTFTRCLLATTWALVTMSPSSDTTNPEPLATATSRFEKIILERQRHVAESQPAASLKDKCVAETPTW